MTPDRHECAAADGEAYRLSIGVIELLDSYLSGRQQQIRLGSNTNSWKNLF